MKKVQHISSFEKTKILADNRRLQILQWLMAEPATLTQLAKRLGQSAARVQHHMNKLVEADLVKLHEVRVRGTVTEKYYQAKAGAFLLQQMILPEGKKPALVFSGSHDLAIEEVSRKLSDFLDIILYPVGSLDGLINLRQGLCHISGVHLLDESGEYNTPYIKHFFPDRAIVMVTLAHRTQGLMFAKGNPKHIKGPGDLTKPDVRFINRNPGSGTRLWVDRELKKYQIQSDQIIGYQSIAHTHTACAQAIVSNSADTAFGLQAAARQFDLEFIPLFEEKYDLIIPGEHMNIFSPLLNHIQTAAFRKNLSSFTGYNPRNSGEQYTLH
ncbi:MAG: helix-turn-helix domain-containing protein [Anaerolineaceae bacterium]|nr:helix-turn-helix domain-containing protein [Anaerolineaceae bacterium]